MLALDRRPHIVVHVRLLSLSTLRAFWRQHPDSERFLREWAKVVDRSRWATAHDIKRALPSADQLGDRLVCFDIHNNHYRLIAIVDYTFQVVLVRFIGTHDDYDHLISQKNWRKKLL